MVARRTGIAAVIRLAAVALLAGACVAALPPAAADGTPAGLEIGGDAAAVVRAAWDYWRGKTSYGVLTMTIHRPSWERTMSMRAWTNGSDHSLVRVTAPKKDAGNGTLISGDNMWSYSPKVNRVIKIPSSMMSQSWMGSDFSNKDVSRADEVDRYEHTLVDEEESDGHRVFVVESVPHEDAAVVWGKEVLRVRDDLVLLAQEFYDQDGRLVKALVSLELGEMGGRTIATRQRMTKEDDPEEWTELQVESMEYDLELADHLFTLSNLRNPRD
jgi:outer membrane lipoprotein-sorting protein